MEPLHGMTLWRKLLCLLPSYRRAVERDMQDELNSLKQMAPAAEFGNLTRAAENARDEFTWRWLEQFVRDVRIGFRSLGRERLFAVSVTLILTLGIGSSVAMFSILNAVGLRPLPYHRPAELVRVSTHLIRQDQWDGSSIGNLIVRIDLPRESYPGRPALAGSSTRLASGSGGCPPSRPLAASPTSLSGGMPGNG
jgi:hypothetical protein